MQEIQVNIISPDGEKTICWSLSGKNLREVIALSNRDPGGSCGGRGTCGKCKVRINGTVSPLTAHESEFLLPEELKLGIRLACYCNIMGPLDVYLDYAPENDKKPIRKPRNYPFKPKVKTESFFINGLEKTTPVPLLKRIANALPGYAVKLSPENINELAKLDRVGRPTLELKALIFGNQLVKYVGRQSCGAYGIALDIGTTSIFALLVDLIKGEVVRVASATNMQRVYGSDVISRISFCLEKEGGLEELHKIVVNNINNMIADLLQSNLLTTNDLYKFTIVGNPVMLHLFLNLSVSGFASVPYSGLFTDVMHFEASAIGIDAHKDAEIVVLPQIGGFVGADTVACLLNISPQVRKFLLIDIGTNGEIVLANGKKLWTASAAAGPAFEGGKISSGMRAGPGAVDQVVLQDDGRIGLNTIGGEMIKGICGSGLIDLIAVLLTGQYIDEYGIINEAANYNDSIKMKRVNGSLQLTISDDKTGSGITITQEDIREVQLAKSALRTGIDILLKEADLTAQDLEVVYLAGAFGNVLKADSCINIGLIPPVSRDKVINIGNAAGEGALKALLSDTALTEAHAWQIKTSYVELANHEDFQDLFINNINFKK